MLLQQDQERPCVAILRTCKLIDTEATHILYQENTFVRLVVPRQPFWDRDGPNTSFLRNLRDSTIELLAVFHFRVLYGGRWAIKRPLGQISKSMDIIHMCSPHFGQIPRVRDATLKYFEDVAIMQDFGRRLERRWPRDDNEYDHIRSNFWLETMTRMIFLSWEDEESLEP